MTRTAGELLTSFERQPLYLKLTIFFIAALIVRLIYGLVIVGPTIGSDAYLFYTHAANLLGGKDFGVPNRPPAFSYAMAGIIGIFDHYPASVVVYQAILSALVPGLMYLLGRDLFAERIGALAAWYSVFHFPLVDYVRLVGSDIQFTFAVVLTAWVVSRASWRRTIVAGLLLGLSALTRGTALTFFPFVALLGLTPLGPRVEGWGRRMIRVTALLVTAGIVLAPWIIRNALRYGAFVPVSSESGINFFQGAQPGFLLYRETDYDLAQKLTGWNTGDHDDLNHPQYQSQLTGYWWRLWIEQPRLQIAMRALSFFDFWSPVERVRFYSLGPGNIYWAVTYGAQLPFFALGGYLILKRRVPGTYFALAAITGATLLHTLSHAEQTRYRGLSVESFVALIACYGAVEYWNWRVAPKPLSAYNGGAQEKSQ
ncbi:MAG: glycosyltransferase family 39 protein [Chloroflexi bacterium]|nr:glycosyltransferase family 39 protein [Chloroflexota bacterium]